MKPEPEFPRPESPQPVGEKLKTFVEKHSEKAISFVLERKPTRGAKKVLLWAKLESKDDATSICELLTQRAQYDMEDSGKMYPYRLEFEVDHGGGRDPLKHDVKFKILPSEDTEQENEEEEAGETSAIGELKSSMREVRYLVKDLRYMLQDNHNDLRLQNVTIANLADKAIARDAESQARIHQLIEESATNRLKLRELEVEEKEILEKGNMRKELMEMLKPAIDAGIEQYTGSPKALKASTDKVATKSGVDKKPTEEKEEDPEHPLAYAAEIFGVSLQGKQWFAINESLDRDQIAALQLVCDSKTDAQAAERFRDFHSDLSKIQFEDLKKVLDRDQKGIIVQLYLAAKRLEKKEEAPAEKATAEAPPA